jgi:hypothetical protein
MDNRTYTAQCFCGAVQLSLSGEPQAMGYCHCRSCRAWAAAPVNAFTLWKPEHVKVTRGADLIAEFRKTEKSHRQFCRVCGGHLMTAHPPFDLIDVYAGVIADFPFKPKLHVHCGESVLPIRDGLPKFKDMPKEMGGTGQMLAEA